MGIWKRVLSGTVDGSFAYLLVGVHILAGILEIRSLTMRTIKTRILMITIFTMIRSLSSGNSENSESFLSI
jgi:hypothetical protein